MTDSRIQNSLASIVHNGQWRFAATFAVGFACAHAATDAFSDSFAVYFVGGIAGILAASFVWGALERRFPEPEGADQ